MQHTCNDRNETEFFAIMCLKDISDSCKTTEAWLEKGEGMPDLTGIPSMIGILPSAARIEPLLDSHHATDDR